MKKVEVKKPVVRSMPLKVSSVVVAKKLGLTNVIARGKPVAKLPVHSIVKTLTGRGTKVKLVVPPKPLPQRGGKNTTKTTKDIASLVPLSDAINKASASTAKAVAIVNDEAPIEKHADADAPRIECKLIVGDLAVKIDTSDLAHTLGGGRWGHGLGLVDQWPDAVWVGLLAHLKLPADTLDRVAAEQPVKRLVQRLWYEAVQGGVPEECKAVFEERDAARANAYAKDFEGVKAGAEGRSARAATSFGRKGETMYKPTEKLQAKSIAFGGQAGFLLQFFKDTKFAPATTAKATEGMVTAGLKTTTKPERISAFYLCQWVKKGLLERLSV